MRTTAILAAGAAVLLAGCAHGPRAEVRHNADSAAYEVWFGDEMFTALRSEGFAKPILYPVLAPGGQAMTRSYPMREVPGEANDHPHQKSLWFAHGQVNHADFWHEGPGMGTIEQESLRVVHRSADAVAVETTNRWAGPNDETIVRDKRLLNFEDHGDYRVLDFVVRLTAVDADAVFVDTKEGTMGIRTHPNLRLIPDPRRGVHEVFGTAVNSEGHTGGDVWGKRAAWVHYQAPIDGEVHGVAFFDSPGNLRHPTHWHARDYGLIAANPFGVHDFGAPGGPGVGDYTLPEGESLVLHYRFLFHRGEWSPRDVAAHYGEHLDSPSQTVKGWIAKNR